MIPAEFVYDPLRPVYMVKSYGRVIDMEFNHARAVLSYDKAYAPQKELWMVNGRGMATLLQSTWRKV